MMNGQTKVAITQVQISKDLNSTRDHLKKLKWTWTRLEFPLQKTENSNLSREKKSFNSI